MDKLRNFLNRNGAEEIPDAENESSEQGQRRRDDEERGFLNEMLDTSTLSWSTRIQGFAFCFILGVVIALLATILFYITLNLFTFRYLSPKIVLYL